MEITEFLTARYNEKQKLAEAVECARTWSPGRGLGALDGHPVVRAVDGDLSDLVAIAEAEPPAAVARFIAAHDPAAVLADLAAKRALLKLWQEMQNPTTVASPDAYQLADKILDQLLAPYGKRATQVYDHESRKTSWQLEDIDA